MPAGVFDPDLFDIFGLIPPKRREWLTENKALLASHEQFGVRFDAYDGCWVRIPGTPPPPNGMIVPLPPKEESR